MRSEVLGVGRPLFGYADHRRLLAGIISPGSPRWEDRGNIQAERFFYNLRADEKKTLSKLPT
jgi:hypothetical protein